MGKAVIAGLVALAALLAWNLVRCVQAPRSKLLKNVIHIGNYTVNMPNTG